MSKAGQRVQRTAWAILSAVCVASALAGSAEAHDAVIGGDPSNGSVVAEFPKELSLEFSGQPQEGFNTFALSRVSDNEILFTGEPVLDGRFVSLELPEKARESGDKVPGEYRIGFQIVSSDGHATKGMTTFTYAPEGSQVVDETMEDSVPTGEVSGSSSSSFSWLFVGGLILLLFGAVTALLLRRGSLSKD
ncbi:copper resistance CopC family protein [Corynebacterium sp. UMB10321]|uniref:copper resistance CopC family protein n=1 Tax=Corynebacterium sp. UMB10321 TaxID=3046312 RepID=UPI002551BE67|nr:copper resistance CopC family protein [Corynebacterium sp. UMB10321]MDK8243813.1 copper resistance protein CopC [Corynebacterium sp. UMB10321]